MERITIRLILAPLCVLAVTSVVNAQGTWFTTTDPGNTEPPGAPWMNAAGGFVLPPNKGDCIWFGKRNVHVATNLKDWTIPLTSADSAKFGFVSATGYIAGAPPTSSPGASTGITDTPGAPPKRTFTVRFIPQPDWEVIKLQRIAVFLGGGDNDASVVSWSHCTAIETTGDEVSLVDAFFGALVEDNILVTELQIFPETQGVGPVGLQSLDPPPGSGNWTPAIVFVDPDGNPRPQGGIQWTTDGNGMAAEDVYGLTLSMAGPADSNYSYFSFDSISADYCRFELPVPKLGGIPTVSEWGLMVMTVLIFTVGTVVIGRRRRPAAA